jgi:hypothetical protein
MGTGEESIGIIGDFGHRILGLLAWTNAVEARFFARLRCFAKPY